MRGRITRALALAAALVLAAAIAAAAAHAQTVSTWITHGGSLDFVGDITRNGKLNFVRCDTAITAVSADGGKRITLYEYDGATMGSVATVWTTVGTVGYCLQHSSYSRDKIWAGGVLPIYSHSVLAVCGHTGNRGNTAIRFFSATTGAQVYPQINLTPAIQVESLSITNSFDATGDTYLIACTMDGADDYHLWMIRFDADGGLPPRLVVNNAVVSTHQGGASSVIPVAYGPRAMVGNWDNGQAPGDPFDDLLIGSACLDFTPPSTLTTVFVMNTSIGLSSGTASWLQMLKGQRHPVQGRQLATSPIAWSGYSNVSADYFRCGVYRHGVSAASMSLTSLSTPGTPAVQSHAVHDTFVARIVPSLAVPVLVNRTRLRPNSAAVSPQNALMQPAGGSNNDRRGESYRHLVRNLDMTIVDQGVFTPDVFWYGSKQVAAPIDRGQHGNYVEPIRWTGTLDGSGMICEVLCTEQLTPNPFEYGSAHPNGQSGYEVVAYADETAAGTAFSLSVHGSGATQYPIHGETSIWAMDITGDGYEEIIVAGRANVVVIEQNTKPLIDLSAYGLWGYLDYGQEITAYERGILSREFKYAR